MIFNRTNRLSARALAVVTVFSMILSAFPAPFSFAEAATTSTLFGDDFEVAGTPFALWTTTSGNWSVTGSDAHSGNKKAKVTGNSAATDIIEVATSTSGYENINLSFWYHYTNLTAGDTVVAEWFDGTNWHTLATFGEGTVSDWTEWTGSLTNAEDNANFALRFTAEIAAGNVTFYLDDVNVSGDEIVIDTTPDSVASGTDSSPYDEQTNEYQMCIYEEPDATYQDQVIAAADRLLALQHDDGSWGWDDTGETGPTGSSYYNVAGVSAQALLDAYVITLDSKYLDAAEEAGDYLVAEYDEDARQNAFNASFLYDLASVSGDSSYAAQADAMLELTFTEENYWSSNNGSNCTTDGCTPEQLYDAVDDYRSSYPGLEIWDLHTFALALIDTDNASLAGDVQDVLQTALEGLTSSEDYYPLAVAGALRAAAAVGDGADVASNVAILENLQEGDGSFADGDMQTTAYALLALVEADETGSVVDDAAAYLSDNFGYTDGGNFDGWLDGGDNGDEYAEIDSEAAHALAQFIYDDNAECVDKINDLIIVTGDTSAGENQEGWLFNRDVKTATPFTFDIEESQIGDGALHVFPIANDSDGSLGTCKGGVDQTGCDKFIAEYFSGTLMGNLETFSYDFNIGSGGDASDENEFYLSVYTNFGDSTNPTTNFYDCRYNVVPTVGVVGDWTTVTFDPEQTYSVAKWSGSTSPHSCPASPEEMGDDAVIRAFAINLGDTSSNDTGLDGYFDNVILDTKTKKTTFDFEPAEPEPYQCSADEVLHLDVENNSTQEPILYGVNTANGALTQLAVYDTPMLDLAVDKDGSIYATTRGGSGNKYTDELVVLKLDGTIDTVGTTGLVDEKDKTVAMGFAYDGTLYALGNHSDKLYELDTTTGNATELNDFSGTIDVEGGDLVVNKNGDIVYVRKDGVVYTIDSDTFAVKNSDSLSHSHYTSLALIGDTYYAMERNSDKFATFELDESNNLINDSYSTGGNFMFGDGASCAVEEIKQTATVTMCKVDEDKNELPGWTLMLMGDYVETVSVPSTGVEVFSANALDGDYAFVANGTYVYRPGYTGSTTDAAFSMRTAGNDPIDPTGEPYDPWVLVNDFDAPWEGYLGITVDGALGTTDWGSVFNPLHEYVLQYFGDGDSAAFKIVDSSYGDNSGSLTVDIYEGYAGVTTENGCVTFTDVPYGTYEADEIMQDGWENVSGLGEVVVDEETETFTVVNAVPEMCSVVVVSDDTNEVEETDDFAKLLTFVHSGWTAVIDGASWIWGDDPVIDPTVDETQTFTKTFEWSGGIASAVFDIAADNQYEVTLNGTVVATSTVDNNFTIATQDSYDLSSYVIVGENTLEITVLNKGVANSTYKSNPAGLKYNLTITSDETGDSCMYAPEEIDPSLEITKPETEDQALSGEYTFEAEYVDADENDDPVQWAIRAGTCNAGSDTIVAGNVDQFSGASSTPYSWDYASFSSTIDMSSWDEGDYCFVVNPTEDGGENFRETRWFTLEHPEPEQCVIVSDTNTIVVENNDYAVETWDEHANWTHDIMDAFWIWDTEYVEDTEVDTTRTFKETFTLSGLEEAKFYIAADNTYSVYINGDLAYERLNTNNYQTHDTYTDVADYLVEGENELLVEVTNLGKEDSIPKTNPAGALFKLKMEVDAEGECVSTTEPDKDNGGNSDDTHTIGGYKYIVDESGNYLSVGAGWTVYASSSSELLSTTTNESGWYQFEVGETAWVVYEEIPTDWNQHDVDVFAGSTTTISTGNVGCYFEIDVEGDEYTCDFYNYKEPVISTTATDDNDGPSVISTGGIASNRSANARVLGASTDFCPQYLTETIIPNKDNNPAEVTRLQEFLNSFEGYNLDVTGFYGAATQNAVGEFQEKYFDEVLTPWGLTARTLNVYYTTRRTVNRIYCEWAQEFPLSQSEQAEVEWFRNLGASYQQSEVNGSSNDQGSDNSSDDGDEGSNTDSDENTDNGQAAAVGGAGDGVWNSLFGFFGGLFGSN